MSVPVAIDALSGQLERYGSVAYVLTVGAEDRPHSVSVRVALDGGELVATVGRTTAANAASRPAVTLLWPPTPLDPAYALIVDGTAVVAALDEGGTLRVTPTRAVQHREADADLSAPSCVEVGGS